MKKVWAMLVLCIFLILAVSMSVLADTDRATAYVDAYGMGIWSKENDDYENDGLLNGVIVGADIPINIFKLGFEYEDASPHKGDEGKGTLPVYNNYMLKCGFRVFGNDRVRVDLTLSHFEQEFDTKETISGNLVGADVLWNISDRMFLQGSLGLSLNGEFQDGSDEENVIIVVGRIKYNYLFTDNFGLGFGIRFNDYIIDLDDDVDDLIEEFGGLTVGATVRF